MEEIIITDAYGTEIMVDIDANGAVIEYYGYKKDWDLAEIDYIPSHNPVFIKFTDLFELFLKRYQDAKEFLYLINESTGKSQSVINFIMRYKLTDNPYFIIH